LCVDKVIYTDYGLSWRNRVDVAHIFRFWDQEEMGCVVKFWRNITSAFRMQQNAEPFHTLRPFNTGWI